MRSGLRLKYTTEPRQYEAGHISLGATWMFYLPPKQESFSLYGTCYSWGRQNAIKAIIAFLSLFLYLLNQP